MIPEIWNDVTYQQYIEYLKSISESNYRDFQKKLCFTKYEILGIRIPILRKIVKKILKTNIEQFLMICQSTYFEEILIEGLVIATIKDEEKFDNYFKSFVKKVDNWAVCDTVCNSLKIIPYNYSKYFKLSQKLSLNKEEFISRVGLIIILNYYIDKPYLNDIFDILNKISSNKYYVNMAEAWLISEIYVKYPLETEQYLKDNNLNNFTHNKAISKIRESFRVSKEAKDYLNTLKRK